MPIRLNIALVEDLDRAQQLFTWLINLFDRMEVTMTARSGQEILEKLKTADPFPDLILVNVVLDGMSGLETVKAIMQQHSRPRIAVFSMCAEDDRRVRDMLDAGCVAFIQKSGDPREIREGILKAVRLLRKERRSVRVRRLRLRWLLQYRAVLREVCQAAVQSPALHATRIVDYRH